MILALRGFAAWKSTMHTMIECGMTFSDFTFFKQEPHLTQDWELSFLKGSTQKVTIHIDVTPWTSMLPKSCNVLWSLMLRVWCACISRCWFVHIILVLRIWKREKLRSHERRYLTSWHVCMQITACTSRSFCVVIGKAWIITINTKPNPNLETCDCDFRVFHVIGGRVWEPSFIAHTPIISHTFGQIKFRWNHKLRC